MFHLKHLILALTDYLRLAELSDPSVFVHCALPDATGLNELPLAANQTHPIQQLPSPLNRHAANDPTALALAVTALSAIRE